MVDPSLWVLVLWLIATQAIGGIIRFPDLQPRVGDYLSLPVIGLMAISGIFYPITALPGWLQGTGQIFPIDWLGLGMRSALLPASVANIEIGQSWRHLETAGVLGLWVAFGLIVAPSLSGEWHAANPDRKSPNVATKSSNTPAEAMRPTSGTLIGPRFTRLPETDFGTITGSSGVRKRNLLREFALIDCTDPRCLRIVSFAGLSDDTTKPYLLYIASIRLVYSREYGQYADAIGASRNGPELWLRLEAWI